MLYNIYSAFTFAHLNSRQNIGSENDFFHTHTLQLYELYGMQYFAKGSVW